MKIFIPILFFMVICFQAFPQAKGKNTSPVITKEQLDQINKYLPPGTKLPKDMMKMIEQAQGKEEESNSVTGESIPSPEPLLQMGSVQEYSFTPEPSPKTDYSPFGSGRNEAQRKAALAVVENELKAKPFLLPLPESAPSKEFMLQMASEWNKRAKQKFNPDDLFDYSKMIAWAPQFDGKNGDTKKAKEFSLAVSMATNNFPKPYFNMALASAVFSLDPLSSSGANNLASAILSSGELICEKNPTKEALAPYRRDAESGFLYALTCSMHDGTWSEASLTPLINFGNLCIDLGKIEEARSMFMVARKIKPESWDAALGLAAYFYAIGKPDKALTVLEDDNLDKPAKYLVPYKQSKSLQKSEKYVNLPPETPDKVYEEGIKIMAAEPIVTAADFLTQLDQSERNKMRYYIENLPPKDSYTAPPIKKLTQYASLKAISSPQGISALNDFGEMLAVFTLGSVASTSNQQFKWLEKMGLKVDLGVDMNDVAKHPEKYVDKDIDTDLKETGTDEFEANLKAFEKEAMKAEKDLATGNIASAMAIATKVDPMFGILLVNPGDYADPMNIILQKMNFTVYKRKENLYKAYLHSVNKRTFDQVQEITAQCKRKVNELVKLLDAEMNIYDNQRAAAEESSNNAGTTFPEATWDLKKHKLHTKYFTLFNNVQETGFGSATNVVSTAYMQKIKPTAERYYYDVIRHVALISDPDVRKLKDEELRNSINQALTWSLQTVLMAHGSFSYSDEWDCSCDEAALLAAREAEQKVMDTEENARIARNKAAKARFDSGEIPESSPLFKKLDSYVDTYNFGLVKVRTSCARTVIEANTDFLPNNLPFNFNYKSSESEFTGAITRNGGIKVGLEKDFGNGGKATANLNLDVSVSSDGNGVVKNYAVTAGADAGVKVGNFKASVGVGGSVSVDTKTGDYSASVKSNVSTSAGNTTVSGSVGSNVTSKNGVTDYSLSGSANASVKYGNTTVSGGASATLGQNGLETDFSSGVSQDLKNGLGTDANIGFEASTKRGCSFSGKVEQTLDPAENLMKSANKAIEDTGVEIPSDFVKKELWPGKFETKK